MILNIFADSLQFMLLCLFLAGTFFYFFEKINPIQANLRFVRKEFYADILFGLINAGVVIPVAQILLMIISAKYVGQIISSSSFAEIISQWPYILQVFCVLLMFDFVTYWRHKFMHYYGWWFHAVHHSVEEISWLTRHLGHPGDAVVALIFLGLFFHLVGVSGHIIFSATVVYTIYDYFIHANFRFGFKGWLRYVFVTPQFHRWHHAVEKEAINKNFSAMFSFYDLLFGSFYCPPGVYPSAYGLSKREQGNYPEKFSAQLLYPFRKIIAGYQRK
jgi:sterol desaturase/sphingolipid hydroxylase (fatty acid hydroxylase superfamily)